ncbi:MULTISPECIES: 4-hydroxy-tetrahydrodipicolinate synthase [Trichococcus]|uniref:4-hydroxy-tetrahydrodipicolinate synthase n=1 Tax=Trichococcus collinsii TaxID=157076 RepID=A0AB38A1I3_9LACT|nr:4-hydroxy-tetrahydrodipicolinate synthase [Trichococcus collinsii]CZQ95294.1 dihydrodipicolinate synthase signature [Trichococcus collinsii]SEA65570.1 4-hydroxy-tetrahydrodipicolinate synthase [Trichococcus collinsii]
MVDIKGIISANVTPMDANEDINEKELRNHVNRSLAAGVDGVFCLGTNGEAYALNKEEKKFVIEAFVDEVKGRVPVYAGTGAATTRETIELSKIAEAAGADVLSIVAPFFAAASQQEIYNHYEAIAKSVNLPIVMYNIPARAGNAIAPETVQRLAQLDNIVGVKDSSGNFDNILQYIELTDPKEFAVLSGNDSLILWTLQAGGAGGITAVANLLPEIMVSIYSKFLEGDFQGAKVFQDSIRPIRNCFKYGNPNTIIKNATNMLGMPVGNNRAPFNYISPEAKDAIQATLEQYYSEYFVK